MRMYPYIVFLGLFCITNCKHVTDISLADTSSPHFCTEVVGDTLCAYQWGSPPPAIGNEVSPEETIHYTSPSINPNNPNQFVCFKQDYSWPFKASIITYDMNTETENILFNFSGVMIGNLSWGKKDWIAFTQGQGTIRIFKSDGSNDHLIVDHSGMNFGSGAGPEWSPDGNYLYYHTINGNPSVGIFCDTMGITVSNFRIIPKPDWNANNQFIGGGGQQIRMSSLSDSTSTIIAEWGQQNNFDQIQSIEWLPDNRHAVFSKYRGLFRVDTHTGEILQMKESCEMKNYKILSVCNEGNFILCEKILGKHHTPYIVHESHEIWKMDINGCNEVRVLPK